jgi:hypothetical protein
MTPFFVIRTTPRFERLARTLLKRHPEFRPLLNHAREILGADPYNRARVYHIKKLEGVQPGDGQYRLRLSRFRFRYDIAGAGVELVSCGLRREDTYD